MFQVETGRECARPERATRVLNRIPLSHRFTPRSGQRAVGQPTVAPSRISIGSVRGRISGGRRPIGDSAPRGYPARRVLTGVNLLRLPMVDKGAVTGLSRSGDDRLARQAFARVNPPPSAPGHSSTRPERATRVLACHGPLGYSTEFRCRLDDPVTAIIMPTLPTTRREDDAPSNWDRYLDLLAHRGVPEKASARPRPSDGRSVTTPDRGARGRSRVRPGLMAGLRHPAACRSGRRPP